MEQKIIVIYDAATGNVETREMTDEEVAEMPTEPTPEEETPTE